MVRFFFRNFAQFGCGQVGAQGKVAQFGGRGVRDDDITGRLRLLSSGVDCAAPHAHCLIVSLSMIRWAAIVTSLAQREGRKVASASLGVLN